MADPKIEQVSFQCVVAAVATLHSINIRRTGHDKLPKHDYDFLQTPRCSGEAELFMSTQSLDADDDFPSDVSVNVDELIEGCLEQLIQHEHAREPGLLREILPETDSDLRSFVLFELIKLDMAISAEAGGLRAIEDYIEALPDLISKDAVPIDLVMEEIQLRKESGDEPTQEEYRRRFPQFELMLSHLRRGAEATAAVGRLGKPAMLPTGSRIDDFLIIQELGQGAFAHVYLARQISMHRLVALKVSCGTGDEPQALAQFDHPNVVRVFDQRAIDQPEVHLLYMQYHPGGTLEDVVRSVRHCESVHLDGQVLLDTVDRNLLRASQVVPDRSSVRRWVQAAEWPMVVAWMGVQLAHALHDAHQRGMLHRDVKPANVLLTAEGVPKLADFNVSFAGAAGRAGAAASFGGSVGYMAPEHLRAISATMMDEPEKIQEPADLYSLGVLLWELWQGHRPFACGEKQASWSDVVAGQLASRAQSLIEPKRIGSASERVLEKSLRSALAYKVEDRPATAAEMAGRLRLALHPEAAGLFDPSRRSIRSWIGRQSPWWVVSLVILIPHIAAGFFHFKYNSSEIMDEVMREGLSHISPWINSVAYPLAVVLMVWYARGLVRAIRARRAGSPVTQKDLHDTLELGHRAAVIGGACWVIAGAIYARVFLWMYPDEFTLTQAMHLFTSSLICGGVAMVYPMFGLALVTTFVYYPQLLAGAIQDDQFDQRSKRIMRRSAAYLLIAAILPLLGAALMVTSEGVSRQFKLIAIGAGVIGLLASFLAYLLIVSTWNRFAEVLSKGTSVVPGERDSVAE